MTVQIDLCQTWSETQETGFLALRLVLVSSPEPKAQKVSLKVDDAPVSVRPLSTKHFKDLFLGTAWQIKAKLHVEHPQEGGAKICIMVQSYDQDGRHDYKQQKPSSSSEPEGL